MRVPHHAATSGDPAGPGRKPGPSLGRDRPSCGGVPFPQPESGHGLQDDCGPEKNRRDSGAGFQRSGQSLRRQPAKPPSPSRLPGLRRYYRSEPGKPRRPGSASGRGHRLPDTFPPPGILRYLSRLPKESGQ